MRPVIELVKGFIPRLVKKPTISRSKWVLKINHKIDDLTSFLNAIKPFFISFLVLIYLINSFNKFFYCNQ